VKDDSTISKVSTSKQLKRYSSFYIDKNRKDNDKENLKNNIVSKSTVKKKNINETLKHTSILTPKDSFRKDIKLSNIPKLNFTTVEENSSYKNTKKVNSISQKLEINLKSITGNKYLSTQDYKKVQEYLTNNKYSKLWKIYLKEIMALVVKDLSSLDEKIRKTALETFILALSYKIELMNEHIIGFLKYLFDQKLPKDKMAECKEARKLSLSSIDIPSTIRNLIPYLSNYDTTNFKILNKMLFLLSFEEFFDLFDNTVILDILFKGIEEKDPGVRRVFVMTIVFLSKKFGEKFDKYLSRLQDTQLRLITYFKNIEQSKI